MMDQGTGYQNALRRPIASPTTAMKSFRVAVNGYWRERRQANRDVLRASRTWCAVTHPLAGMNDDRLSGRNFVDRVARFHLQFAIQNNRVFVKLRSLSWFAPARRAGHLGDTDIRGLRVDAANELFDDFRRLAGCRNNGRC